MRSTHNKKQIIELRNLLDFDLSRNINSTGRNALNHYFREFSVIGTYAYSASLR